MESTADKDLFTRYRWPAWAAFAALVILESVLMAKEGGVPRGGCKVAIEVALATTPNLIAALLTLFVLHYVVKEDKRSRYVEAMRSLRQSVKKMNLKPEEVQSLMVEFVPTISNLYFQEGQPRLSRGDDGVSYPKAVCFSCQQPSPVVQGRCTKCKDIRASWESAEKQSVTAR